MTDKHKKLIERHNAKIMKMIHKASLDTGLSQATLYYATAFGIMGIWGIDTKQKTKEDNQ